MWRHAGSLGSNAGGIVALGRNPTRPAVHGCAEQRRGLIRPDHCPDRKDMRVDGVYRHACGIAWPSHEDPRGLRVVHHQCDGAFWSSFNSPA